MASTHRHRRRHSAKRGRVVAAVVSAGSFAAITGAMAVVDTTPASATTPTQPSATTPSTTATTTPSYDYSYQGDDGYGDGGYYYGNDSQRYGSQNWGATPTPGPAVPQAPMTQSHGS